MSFRFYNFNCSKNEFLDVTLASEDGGSNVKH